MNIDSSIFYLGPSESSHKLFKLAEKIAEYSSPVLIRGEPSTGKKTWAKLIHSYCPFTLTGKFIVFNCSNSQWIQSAHFRNEQTEFADQKGLTQELIKTAHKGTLYLADVDELPYETQGHLLNFIKDNELHKVEQKHENQFQVRIIASTKRDLEKTSSEEILRKDLFYLLGFFKLDIPPLRKRYSDIPGFVDFFLKKYKEKDSPLKILEHGLLDKLSKFPWPGNITQLEIATQRALIVTNEDQITFENFDLKKEYPLDYEIPPRSSLREAIDTFKRQYIKNILAATNGNRTRAAKILDVQRSYLSRLLKEFKID